MKTIKKIIKYGAITFLFFIIFNAFKIYNYASEYSEKKSDVAIVLGARTYDGIPSPVFKERINHGIYLYKKKLIKKIIFTGGRGTNQSISESETAQKYAIEHGIPKEDILIEEFSHYTFENLIEAKKIMDSLHFSTALIVSDPFHMKRSMEFANTVPIICSPSPTRSSMYRTTIPKLKSLTYETFFYTLGKLAFKH